MTRPRLQRAATARREKVQLRIREQSFVYWYPRVYIKEGLLVLDSSNLYTAVDTPVINTHTSLGRVCT
jgi:hypothetical protein